MHPLFARFMDFHTARRTLALEAEGAGLAAEERAYLRVAAAFPEARAALLAAKDSEADHPDTAQPLLLLAVHTAAGALEEDSRLGPALARAREALVQEGATPAQVRELIATLLLEEAFGYEDEAREFDVEFVLASLGEVPQLARLTPEGVEALQEAFLGGKADPVRRAVVEALVEQAWGEGPAFVNPEHIEAAIEEARGVVAARELARVPAVMRELLEALRARGYVSDARLGRLEARVAELRR